jgi:hypothetical protein
MSAMFGNTITDQSYQNAAVGNTLVADKIFTRSVNFTETNIIDGIDPDIPIRTLRVRYPPRFPPQPQISLQLIRDFTIPVENLNQDEKEFYCYEITCSGDVDSVDDDGIFVDFTFNITLDDEPVITDGSGKNLVNNGVVNSVKDYNHQSFGECGTKIRELVKLKNNDVLECTFSRPVLVNKLDIICKGVYVQKSDI